jgi:hypothetical protein
MPLITDPDVLAQGVEVTITTATKKITLNIAGDLSTDGITLKCLYSFLKEEWKQDSNLIKYPFPMVPITDEQFELVNGWDLFDDASKFLVRTGGWALKDAGGVSQEEWAGIVTLGTLGATDQVYFEQEADTASVDFELEGAVNQAIKIYGDVSHGTVDFRSFLKLFVRIYQKAYASSQLSDIGVGTLTYQVYRFPLTNSADLKISHNDAAMVAGIYANIDITWFATAQARMIGSNSRDFHVIIDGNSATAEQIYEKVQYLLRKITDIDEGTGEKLGNITPDILRFVGETLYTLQQPDGGVYIDSFLPADTNRLVFADDLGTPRTFPYVAALALNFGENLVTDTGAKFYVFFTNDDAGDNASKDYGTADAILVNANESAATVNRMVAANTATIETAAAHNLSIGDGVCVTGMTDATYNGNFIVTAAPDTTHFSYALTHAPESEAADVAGTVRPNMVGNVDGQASIQFSFNYDGNIQRGAASAGDPAPITVVAIGLQTAQFVKATGTINQSIANSVSLVAPLERNYANPV